MFYGSLRTRLHTKHAWFALTYSLSMEVGQPWFNGPTKSNQTILWFSQPRFRSHVDLDERKHHGYCLGPQCVHVCVNTCKVYVRLHLVYACTLHYT